MTVAFTKPPLSPGDIAFFKRAKKTSHRKSPEIMFKGHAFGIILGIVPPFQKDPVESDLMRMIGTVGFLSFDDVAEFLGDVAGAECVKKFEDKYYGKVVAEPMPPCTHREDGKDAPQPCYACLEPRVVAEHLVEHPELVLPDAPKILGLNGKPIGGGDGH